MWLGGPCGTPRHGRGHGPGCRGCYPRGRYKILTVMVVNSKVGELGDYLSEEFIRQRRKELIGLFGPISGKKRFLSRFQDMFEKV